MATVGNDVVIFGGQGNGVVSDKTWLLSNVTARPRWTLLAPEGGVVPSARLDHAVATVGNDMVICGGGNTGQGPLAHSCVLDFPVLKNPPAYSDPLCFFCRF